MTLAERKIPVTWTQHEETLIAIEIHRMRTGEVDSRWPAGQYARTLPAQINLAQKRVLEPARRKTDSAVYYQGKHTRFDEAWYQQALARKGLYETAAPAEAEAEAAPPPEAPAEAPQEADPETESLLIMGSMLQQFISYIDSAVARGVRQALVELRDEEERKLRHNGDHNTPAPSLPTTAREIVKRKIDVIGLLPGQQRVVEASPIARIWDIRFLQSGTKHGQADLRERVIICSKWVSHHQQGRYRQMKANIHWANGGAMSVIQQLERLGRVATNGNGSGATH